MLMLGKTVFLLLLIGFSTHAWAYKYHNYRWKQFPIVWYLDTTGYPLGNITRDQLKQDLQAAFDAWQNVRVGDKCTSVRFKFGGFVSANGAWQDGKNVISFCMPTVYDGMPGVSQTPNSLGKTVVVFDANGYVREADILFPVTDAKVFSDHPNHSQYDLIGIAMHQIGHMLGIDHSQVSQATMYGVWPPAGDTSWRTLEDDDKQAVLGLYPGTCPDEPTGELANDVMDNTNISESEKPPQWRCSTDLTAHGTPRGFLLLALVFVVLLSRRKSA